MSGLHDGGDGLLGGWPSGRRSMLPRDWCEPGLDEMGGPLMGLPRGRFNRRRPRFHGYYDSEESDVLLDFDDDSDFDVFSDF